MLKPAPPPLQGTSPFEGGKDVFGPTYTES